MLGRSPRRIARVLAPTALALGLLVAAAPAHAQSGERIVDYEVAITIEADGSLTIVEAIDYDFGAASRHGILRDIPTTLRFDDTYDRVYPIEVVDVRASEGTPAAYAVESVEGGLTRIRVGDADVEISGRHAYELTYTVEGALNAFRDHDELYWNAIGTEWSAPIERASVTVRAPADITQVACFQGYAGSTLPCDRAGSRGRVARFAQANLGSFSGVTVVVGLPKGAVPEPAPVLEERWSVGRAFEVTPATVGGSAAIGAAAIAGVVALVWRRGRDRRFRGSPVDQVLGNPTGEHQAVPLGEADDSAPVEFAPPDDMRPGQMGTLLDEQANVLDVSATLVDLAVRGFLLIQEIPKEGWFGKPDWRLIRLEKADDDLHTYERRLLNGLFRDGTETTISELKNTFAARLEGVQESLYADAVRRGWFSERPDKVRTKWLGLGVVALIAAGAAAFVLAAFTHWGLARHPARGRSAPADRHGQAHAGTDGEGHGDAAAGPWVPHRHRDRRDAHVAVGREGARLHALPAVRGGVRLHRPVGEGLRGAGRPARHELVRLAAALRLRAVRRLDGGIRGDHRRHDRLDPVGLGVERILGRRFLRRRRRGRRRRQLVTSSPAVGSGAT